MFGAPDPLYVRARAALLDATDALAPFLDATVLVGAQAVYLRAGPADLLVVEYTTDADFALEPAGLPDSRSSKTCWSHTVSSCGGFREPG